MYLYDADGIRVCSYVVQDMVDHPMLFLDPLNPDGDDDDIPHDDLLQSLDEDIGMPFDDLPMSSGAFGDLEGGLDDHHLDGISF